MMSLGEQNVNNTLTKLSLDLLPSDNYFKEAKETLYEIINILPRDHNIDRTFILGSEGRETTILNSPFVCYIFLNDDYPPYNIIMTQIQKDLSDLDNSTVHRTKFYLDCQYKGYNFRFIPATNHLKKTKREPKEDNTNWRDGREMEPSPGQYKPKEEPVLRCQQQYKRPYYPSTPGSRFAWQALSVYKAIERDRDRRNAHHFSSSVCEVYNRFLKSQSIFTQDLVRLCDFWQKTLLSSLVEERSNIIELVAIHAGQIEEDRSRVNHMRPVLLNAFQIFLKCLEQFQQVEIEFNFDPLGPIRHIITDWHYRSRDPNRRTRPFIIDPSNPYNNVLRGMKSGSIRCLQRYASTTLVRLERIVPVSRHYVADLSTGLFYTQPGFLPYVSTEQKDYFRGLKISVHVTAYGSLEEDEELGKGMTILMGSRPTSDHCDTQQMQEILNRMENLFTVVALSFTSGYKFKGTVPEDEGGRLEEMRVTLKKRMEDCVWTNVLQMDTNLSIRAHGDYQSDDDDEGGGVLTFKFPLVVYGGTLLVVIRFRKEEEEER